MNRSHEQPREPVKCLLAEAILDPPGDPRLQLLRCPLGERERDDRLGRSPVGEQVNDPLGDDLSLPRPRAGDDLQMAASVADSI